MTMPSRRSTSRPTAARRRSVSFLPRPASTSSRVWSVSSNVQLPELPEPRIVTRRLINSPGGQAHVRAGRTNNDKRERTRQSGNCGLVNMILSRTGFSLSDFDFLVAQRTDRLKPVLPEPSRQQIAGGAKAVQAAKDGEGDA